MDLIQHPFLLQDAAQSCGFGTIFGTHWTYGKWPDKWKQQDISVLELYPIVLGVHLWAARLKNKRVLFYSDNESVVHVINKQTSKHKGLLALVWQLVLICLSQNIYFKARRIPGRHNVLADSLSRLQVERFLSLTRGMDSLPTTIPHIYNQTTGKYTSQTLSRQFEHIVTQNLPTGLEDFSAFRD